MVMGGYNREKIINSIPLAENMTVWWYRSTDNHARFISINQ
jgi:hypothetical protein